MDTIRGLPEAVESEDAAAIEARDESLGLFAGSPGLGPPDLCWLAKSTKATWTTAATPATGYYHHLLGRDVSSSAAIAAYFAELCARVEQPQGVLQGLFHTGEFQIDRGFYCCYDPFSQTDVRCELAIPGGVATGAVDADGGLHAITPDIWRNVTVASFLRHQLYDPDVGTYVPALHRWHPMSSPGGEGRLLDAVYGLYASGVLPGALDVLCADSGRGCTPEHVDLVLHCVLQWFGARHRWRDALAFFSRLQKVYGGAAVYQAAVLREMDRFDDSFSTLSGALEVTPSDPALLLALANECLYAGQVDLAAKLSRRAVRQQRGLRAGWLLLARCYIRQGAYALALTTLNVVPPPPTPRNLAEAALGVLPPEAKRLTQPVVPRYDPDQAAARAMEEEEVVTDGSRSLMYLPAAVMLPRDPIDMSHCPDLGPGRITLAVLASAYALLQELVAAIGWDSFLEMRARVFVMQSETATDRGGLPQATSKSTSNSREAAGQGQASAYDLTLEELAAAGLDEYDEELEEARRDNAAAAAAVAAEADHEVQQHDAKLDDEAAYGGKRRSSSAGIEAARMGSLATAFSVSDGGFMVEREPTLTLGAIDMMSSVFHGARWSSLGGLDAAAQPAPSPDPAPAPAPTTTPTPTWAPATATAPAPPAPPALESRPSLLASIPGTTALWSLIFGAAQAAQQPPRPPMDKSIIAVLQQHGSVPVTGADGMPPAASGASFTFATPAAGGPAGRRAGTPQPRPQPIAEGSEQIEPSGNPHPLPPTTLGRPNDHNPWTDGTAAELSRQLSETSEQARNPHTRFNTRVLHVAAPPHAEAGRQSRVSGPLAEGREPAISVESEEEEGIVEEEEAAGGWSAGERSRRSADVQRRLGVGAPISDFEADRNWVLLGAAAMESLEGQQRAKARRLCIRWLDELIIALWHDLQAYMEWKMVDGEVMEATGNTLAGLVLGLPPPPKPKSPGKEDIASRTSHASSHASSTSLDSHQLPAAGDWMRRGLLAERLFHDEEALAAYRCCLATAAGRAVGGGSASGSPKKAPSPAPNLVAAHAVMRLAAAADEAELALKAAVQVLSWHAGRLWPTGALPAYIPTAPACCISHLGSRLPQPELATLADRVLLAAGLPGLATASSRPDAPAEQVTSWVRQMITAARAAAP